MSVGTAKSGVPMKTRRIQAPPLLADVMRRYLILSQCLHGLAALGRLPEFPYHHVALELGDIVDEQHAVGMIDLVLQAGGEQALGFNLMLLAVQVQVLDAHFRRPRNLLVIFWDRQAPPS